ncbi:MAG: thioredoxin domain-containing protein [Salibacteraceae bacterium]
MESKQREPNALINETSPYLLQHAYNPVNWLPWNESTLQKARDMDKPILVSIGYSSCHWCHVMEKESFEDENVARIMNENFVCIKVDREERPDVDQVYMDAVQLMTGSGGWPLNCFALPDGRPFFGGTYFPKQQWIEVLQKVTQAYKNQRGELQDYAARLAEGVEKLDDLPISTTHSFGKELLLTVVGEWNPQLDNENGGPDRAPKFPLPNSLSFMLYAGQMLHDDELKSHVHLTLKAMARGGIFDQLGGGFARYSTDKMWKVPHFEKMLYDNAQLLTTYSEAYRQTRDDEYLRVINSTIGWMVREMRSEAGGFYSALDADSEGEEGKYYVWTIDEIKSIAGKHYPIVKDYYGLGSRTHWEENKHILMRHMNTEELAEKHQMGVDEIKAIVEDFRQKAMEERSKRERPGTDDKILTSWNALCVKGLCEAYAATNNEEWLQLAISSAEFLLKHVVNDSTQVLHTYHQRKKSDLGFLDDYAFLSDALIRLYEVTFDETYLVRATEILEAVFDNFVEMPNGMYSFTNKNAEPLFVRKAEITDDVIPASNSVLATTMYKLGLIHGRQDLLTKSSNMCLAVSPNFLRFPQGYSQWLTLYMMNALPYFEVAICGPDATAMAHDFRSKYLPQVLLCGSEQESSLPILQNRYVADKTLVYVCQKGACSLPHSSAEAALTEVADTSD